MLWQQKRAPTKQYELPFNSKIKKSYNDFGRAHRAIAPDRAYRLVVMHRLAPNFAEAKVFYSYISFGWRVIISLTFPLQV